MSIIQNLFVGTTGYPILKFTIEDIRNTANDRNYAFVYETTRSNGSVWCGHNAPPTSAHTYFNQSFMVGDPASGGILSGGWLQYVGGNPRSFFSWSQIFVGLPPTPTLSQFPSGAQWAFKLQHPIIPASAAPPLDAMGPLEIIPCISAHVVGIGQWEILANPLSAATWVIRLANTSSSAPLIFGTPTLTVAPGDETHSSWYLSTSSIPTINPGTYYEMTLSGYLIEDLAPNPVYDRSVMLTLPNNLSGAGSPNIYLDFGLFITIDD